MTQAPERVGADDTPPLISRTDVTKASWRRLSSVMLLSMVAGAGTAWLVCKADDGGNGHFVHRILGIPGGNPSIKSDPSAHFKNMLSYHRGMDSSIPDGVVLFLGDSITQSLAVAAVASHAINLGIGHQTTEMMLEALPSYKSLDRASVIVLTIGINDILHGDTMQLNDRLRRINAVLPADKRVIWNAIMPVGVSAGDDRVAAAITSANSLIRNLCAARRQCVYVDTWALFAPAGAIEQRAYRSDGIHLNDYGYSRWIAVLRATI